MAGKNTSAFGIYKDETSLRLGFDALQREGFRVEDISVLFPDNSGTKDFAHEKGTKAPEGATAGAGSGAVVGGVLGWLAGIGTIAIPGVGPFLAAGPIMAALAGAGVGGAVGFDVGALLVAVDVEFADALRGAGLNVALAQTGRGGRGVDAEEHSSLRRHNRLRARSVDLSERCDLGAMG